MHSKYLDEFEAGQEYQTGKASLSEGQILEFAMMYDPQHMHIDHQAAESGPFGGVIASGFPNPVTIFPAVLRYGPDPPDQYHRGGDG